MDQTPADQPFDDLPGGSGSGGVSEQELLDVLAEASKLAGELAVQLDGEQLPPPMDIAPTLQPQSSKVEDQIDDLDVLLAATSDELGEAPPSPNENSDWDAEPSDETAASSVPDFMDEFTHAEGASESSPAPAETPPFPQREPKPGVVGTGLIGVAKAEQPTPEPAAEEDPVEEAPSRRSMNLGETYGKITELATSAVQNVLTLTLPAADKVVGILEKADRPLGILKAPVRRVIGWLAIATLGTSAFVFIWSLI